MKTFELSQGDTPQLQDLLSDESGAVNLAGCEVVFIIQGPAGNSTVTAVIDDAAAGKVAYRFTAQDTANPGLYQAQWRVTSGSQVRTFPSSGYITFTVQARLPLASPSGFTRLSELYEDIRGLTGDFDRQLYEDSALASVMRSVLRGGKVAVEGRVWRVGPDGNSLVPAIAETDVQAYSLLTYHSALRLVLPNLASYSYRTRALSERFGEARDFLAELKNTLYELEAGDGIYASVSGLRSSLFAVNGISAWSYLQAAQTIELSFK